MYCHIITLMYDTMTDPDHLKYFTGPEEHQHKSKSLTYDHDNDLSKLNM